MTDYDEERRRKDCRGREGKREGGTGLHIQIKINDIETVGLEQTASDRSIIGHWTPATPQFRLS